MTAIPGVTTLAFPDVNTLGTALIVVFLLVAAAVVALSWIGNQR